MTLNIHRIALRGLLFSMALCCLIPMHGAQREGAADSISVTFLFHLSESRFRSDYADNANQYRLLADYVSTMGYPSGYMMRLTTSSSPDGPKWFDRKLSYYRALNTQRYLCSALPSYFNDSTDWHVAYRYADWSEFIKALQSSNVTGKDEVLQILKDEAISYKSSTKEKIKSLNEGLTWAELEDSIMPSLRYANVCIHRVTPSMTAPQAVATGQESGVVINPDSIPPELLAAIIRALEAKGIQVSSASSGQGQSTGSGQGQSTGSEQGQSTGSGQAPSTGSFDKLRTSSGQALSTDSGQVLGGDQVPTYRSDKYQFALKTNLLYDAMTALNLELEFPIKNRVSILGEAVFPWWICPINGQYYTLQIMHASIECRYWFGDRTTHPLLQGWFAGIYAASTIYDLEWQNHGYQGESYIHGGVTAGYSFQVAPNWRIETSIGIGYMPNQYREYNHRTDLGLLVWQRNGSYNWIGPTKLKCSVSWLIPSYSKKQKGGEQ